MRKVLVCCVVLLALTGQALANEKYIQFVNSTNQDIVGIYLSPAGTRKWGSSLMEKIALKPNGKVNVLISQATENCRCDLKYMLTGKQAYAIKAVDMCSARKIELFLKDDEASAKVQ